MNPTDPHSPESVAIDLVHDRDRIDGMVRGLLEALARHGYTESSRFAVRLAVEEALANAFRHGHKELAHGASVHMEYHIGPKELRVVISDRGPGFDPNAVPDPTLDANLELPSGRGLMLMRAYMTSVTFNAKGNQVTMVYRKPQGRK